MKFLLAIAACALSTVNSVNLREFTNHLSE